MEQIFCLSTEPEDTIECLCFDEKACDIHIDEGGNLICRHGSNEGIVDGVAKVICPLEIYTQKEKWNAFLNQEKNENL